MHQGVGKIRGENVSAKRKILLVDDSPLVRMIVAHTLQGAGHSVSSIDDPSGLDEAVERERPDLLLVDATFPGVTDDQLLAAISRHVAARPVVLFSDRSERELLSLVDRSGARGHMPKDGATLVERLSAFL
jgi:DNA-binding NarL/FixJ family response regulator